MYKKWLGLATAAVFAVATVGGDSGGGGAAPKANNPGGTELKQRPKPEAPGGSGGGNKAPGGKANVE